jgi:hypothetical protein
MHPHDLPALPSPAPVPARRGARRALALLAAAAALAGCHPRRPPPDLSADPAELLAAVRAAQEKARSVEGRARVGVDGPDGGGSADQFLAAEKPGRVRVEAYDFFGNVAAVLAVDGGALALYDAREKVFYRGAATARNVARLVPVAVSPAELATLLCGSAPLLDGEPVSAEPGDGVMVLTLRAGDLLQRLEIGPGAAILASRVRRLGPDGREAPAGLDAEFSVHRTSGGARVPTDVAARAPAARVALALHWRERQVNQPVDPALFHLEPPKGARVVDLDPAAP